MKKENYNILGIIVWWIFAITMGLTIYVNYYLPHGKSYPTGEIVCQNDGRGPCVEQYKEDMRSLNIPDWAKFLRKNSVLFFMGLPILAMYLQAKGGKKFN